MHAIQRLRLIPLVLAAAAAIAAGPAHQAAPAGHHTVADQICPAGSNWDNVTQSCVP
jgi:hypothetical protein